MGKHVFKITHPAKDTPSTALPDGAITGNGDVTATLAGGPDRVRIYIGKADFWKADGRVYTENRGGIAPLGLIELLLPQMAYADYLAEQDIDECRISLCLTAGKLSVSLKITVCATDNTILLELDRPIMSSASVSLLPLEGSDAVTEVGSDGDVSCAVRGFDSPQLRFPSYGICALRRISRARAAGREKSLWAVCVSTSHDTAAWKAQTTEKISAMTEDDAVRLLSDHAAWWRDFWSKSAVNLPDSDLELYWYAGIYAVACTARNKKFPPGLWGAYCTSDGMGWFGDYHLNYNYQAPFYALSAANHPELIECYSSPINDYLPLAKRWSEEFLGIKGSLFPVGLGPLGLETDLRPDTKEHGHLFHGQKSNGAYAAVIPMMHWYSTRDKDFARREYYDFLLSVAEFWENYLVFEDGEYQIYNDALNEVCWYASPDAMPEGHDDKNPIISRGLVKMLMKLMIDISSELGENEDRIPKWQHILDHTPDADAFELDGVQMLRSKDGCEALNELTIEYAYLSGRVGKYTSPWLFGVTKNTHRRLSIWDSHNRFCSYYPMAARLEYDPAELISHIREVIEKRSLPSGMFRYGGGGLENSAAIPATVCEMLLQSYEDIIRLFPCWDVSRDASFKGLRAFGAFVVDGSVIGGEISAVIRSEKGRVLRVEKPGDGYCVVRGDETIPLTEQITVIETKAGETLTLRRAGK